MQRTDFGETIRRQLRIRAGGRKKDRSRNRRMITNRILNGEFQD